MLLVIRKLTDDTDEVRRTVSIERSRMKGWSELDVRCAEGFTRTTASLSRPFAATRGRKHGAPERGAPGDARGAFGTECASPRSVAASQHVPPQRFKGPELDEWPTLASRSGSARRTSFARFRLLRHAQPYRIFRRAGPGWPHRRPHARLPRGPYARRQNARRRRAQSIRGRRRREDAPGIPFPGRLTLRGRSLLHAARQVPASERSSRPEGAVVRETHRDVGRRGRRPRQGPLCR